MKFLIVPDKHSFMLSNIKFYKDEVQAFVTKEGSIDTMQTHLPYLRRIEGMTVQEYKTKCAQVK